MLKLIYFLTTDNPYNTTVVFARGLKKAIENLGIKTRTFSMKSEHAPSSLSEILQTPPDLLITFNYISVESAEGDRFLSSFLNVPQLTYWLDSPVFVMPFFKEPLNWVSVVDRNDYLGLKGLKKNVLFLPHAVEKKSSEDLGEKPLDIVMTASYLDFEERKKSWQRYPLDIQQYMEMTCDDILSGSCPSMMVAMQRAFKGDFQTYPFEEIYLEVEYYCKGWDRYLALKALKAFNIDLFGLGTFKLKGLNHVKLHRPISYKKTIELYSSAKVVLNSAPQFRNGSHERVFNALSVGSLAVTNSNPYLFEEFGEEKGVLYYDHANTKALTHNLKRLLADEKIRGKQTSAGFDHVMKNHTWDVRAQEIINSTFVK